MHWYKTVQNYTHPFSRSSEPWIAEGWQLARREKDAAFETIEIQHIAEVAAHDVLAKDITAQGSIVLQRRTELDTELESLAFNRALYLRQLAHGRADLRWAIALFILNAALAVFVLLAFGPAWLAVMLSLVILVSALPIEEFFQALESRSALREGIFLALAILALGAQFWLGAIRGLFLAALTPNDAGPITHVFRQAVPMFQYALGIFSIASEIMCGYKLSSVRSSLLSATVTAARERDRLTQKLSDLYNALESARVEPGIRRAYRAIGARQYLAWTAGENRRADASHLKRAVRGAIIALIAFSLLLFLASQLRAATIPVRNIISVLDLSKSVSPENLHANLDAVSALLARLNPGDRMVIVGITDSFGKPRLLLDQTMPASGGYLNLQMQAAHERTAAQWLIVAKSLRPTYPRTDIVGALSVLPYLGGAVLPNSAIFIFSDLQNSTPELDLEHMERIPVERILASLKQLDAIPSLKHSSVFLLGVDPVGKSAAYYTTLREFWFAFFREAGAEVRAFSIDRGINHIPDF